MPRDHLPESGESATNSGAVPVAKIAGGYASFFKKPVFEKIVAPMLLELIVTVGTFGIFGGMGVAAAGKGTIVLTTSFAAFLILLFANILTDGRHLLLALRLWIIYCLFKLIVDLLVIAIPWLPALIRRKSPVVNETRMETEAVSITETTGEHCLPVAKRPGKRIVVSVLMELGLTVCTLGIFGGLGVLAADKGKGRLELSFSVFAILLFSNIFTCFVFFPETVFLWMIWCLVKLFADLVAICT